MKRTLFGVILTIAIVLTGCFLWEEAPNTVALSSISSYEVYEFNAIGLKAVAIRKEGLPKPMQGTELSLTVEGIAYSLEANPLLSGILQAILLDRHSAQAIRESQIALSRGMRGLSERAGITIASVIIRKAPGENGTELYRIGTEDYISLRMANRFVFTAGGSFIAPEDVVSSEGKVYPTDIFLQARMATGSIDGAFAWLKGHPELEATGLVYNRVRLVQGQIVIDPPEEPFRLRDLGPEGDLVEQEHVYNIISNSGAQIWSVFIHTERLPESFRAFDEWALRLGEVEYDFSPNATNPAIYELSVLYAITQNIESIRNSQFFGRSEPVETFSLTLNRNPVAGGAVSGAGQYVPGTSISVVASPGAGYRFVNWTQSGAVVSAQASFSYTMPSANVTLIANFEAIPPQTVTITAQSDPVSGGEVRINTGSWGGNRSVTVNSGTAVILEAQEKSGYNWDGWYEGSLRVSFNKSYQITATANKTYKGKFSPVPPGTTYTLTLKADPATGAAVSGGGAYRAGTMMTIRANLSSDAYQFWAWTRNGVVVSYLREDVFIMPNENVTLVAEIYRVKPYGMVLAQRGIFQMGDAQFGYSKPVHTARLMYNFWIGKYEVTFSEYDAFCVDTERTKPSDQGWGRGMRPAINVSWNDAVAYCNWLSGREGLRPAYDTAGNLLDKNGQATRDITQVEGYRLPTEAEWEYAARGGHRMTSPSFKYAGSDEIGLVAWYTENSDPDGSGKRTQPVGLKLPNELGLFDMSGNVWEWCYDWKGAYTSDPQTNPIGPETGRYRIYRGGSMNYQKESCQVGYRPDHWSTPSSSSYSLGFRLARTVF